MPASRVSIIKPGTIRCEAHEVGTGPLFMLKEWCGVGGGSTVTYIESDKRIIVDTGFDFETRHGQENQEMNERNLLHALESNGISPEDIDTVILTHHHKDHTGNLGIFPNVEVITSFQAEPWNRWERKTVKNNDKIADGIIAIETPGHTRDHLSLLVETEAIFRKKRRSGSIPEMPDIIKIGIAGDAIVTAEHFLMGTVWSYNSDFYSEEVAKNSMNRLAKMCDYIIPGHGVIFKV